MEFKLLIFGITLVLLGAYAHSAELNGSCSNSAIQCELSVNELELCNNSATPETYKMHFNGSAGEWFSVMPNIVTLQADECTKLKVYTVANCYAEPGNYSAELLVQNGETISITCNLEVKQGHFIDLKVEPKTQNATQCEEKTYNLLVTNNTIVPNQNTERVDLSITGLPENWYNLAEQRILVDKDQTERVELKVKAPCEADFGNYEFTARAALPNPDFYSSDNGEYILNQGQSIQLVLDEGFEAGKTKACLETASEKTIKISNNGKLADNVKLTLEGTGFAKLEQTNFSLEPNEQKIVKIKFSPTSEKTGEYDFTLKLESMLYDYSTSKTFSAELQDCYNLEIESQGQEKVCVEDKPVYKFTLENNQVKAIEADLKIEGIEAELSSKKISIQPGEKKEITATLDVSKLAKKAKAKRTDLAVELVIDSSGSMVERVNGKNKMDSAKEAIINLVNNINEVDLGLRIFGQGNECENSELLVPVKNLNIAGITDKVATFKPLGKTPLTEALKASVNDFPAGKEKVVILVSDGKETCNGNISQTARELAAKKITVYSIGFDIDEKGKTQLQEISSRTNGKYFDAHNAEELDQILQEISKELEILPSTEGKNTFTIKLDSENFSFEKDFSIEIMDCFNTALVVPELNVCPGVEKEEIITLANLGTEKQKFELSYSPPWVEGPKTVEIEGNSKVNVQIKAKVPNTNANTEKKFVFKAVSSRTELEQEKNINYLSNSSCFGIDLIVLKPEIDAATCTGQKQSIMIENRGVVEQEITLTVDKPYAYLTESKFNVKPGERKEVNFFVSPPFDLPETTYINFEAQTNRGFKTSAKIKLFVTGNEQSFGLGEINIVVKDLNFTEVKDLNNNMEIKFNLYNDSNRTLEILDVKVLDFNGIVQLENRLVKARETVKARALVKLAENLNGTKVTVPISVETDEGTYVRNLTFDYNVVKAEEKTETEVKEPVSVGTGLFTLANISTAILGILIIIVIALIAFTAFKATGAKEEVEEIEEINPETGKKMTAEELKEAIVAKEAKKKAAKAAAKKKK